MAMLTLLVLLTAGAAALVLESFIRKPALVAASVVLAQVARAAVELPSVFLGPFRVGADDVLTAILLAAAVARLLRSPRLTTPQRLALTMLCLVLVSLARGVVEFGIATATDQSRGMLPFVVAVAYFATVSPSPAILSAIGRVWLSAGTALAVLALLRWGAPIVGLQGVELFAPTASFGRVLQFSEALLLSQATLLCLPAMRSVSDAPLLRRLCYALLPIAILLQHRTAWAALLVGLAAMVVLDRRLGRRLGAAVFGAVAVGAVLSLTLFAEQDQGIPDALEDTATTTGTWQYRTHGWQELLADTGDWNVLTHATGEPLGASFERQVPGDRVTESQPHNYYLHLYLRTGVIGLLLAMLLYLTLIKRLSVRAEGLLPGAFSPPMLVLMLLTQLTMFVSYAPSFEQGILLGLAVAAAGRPIQARIRRPPTLLSAVPQQTPMPTGVHGDAQ